jgi:DNA-binding SARP family transcriptional activator
MFCENPGGSMPQFYLRLLGTFEYGTENGETIALPTKKAKALLTYLAMQPGRAHSRAKLAALLWEDSGEEQARDSLRQTLTLLRKALSPACRDDLVAAGDAVTLKVSGLWIDAIELQKLARASDAQSLEAATELYRGEFLEGFDLRAAEFDEWLSSTRQALREIAADVLFRLLDDYRIGGNSARSFSIATRLLAIDPLRESVHRALMELYSAQGRHTSALQQYQRLSERLWKELRVEPDAESKALWRQIRDQRAKIREKPAVAATPAQSFDGATINPSAPTSFERRHITILACELAGIEAFSVQSDPEELQPVLDTCRKRVEEMVATFGGVVGRFSGDGVTVYFGYPLAQEHGAEQAVRAGLHLAEQVPLLDFGLSSPVHVSVGIASGAVVVGEMAEMPGVAQAMLGGAAKLAALLQSAAEPGTVLISDATRRLVGDLFHFRPAAAQVPSATDGARVWLVTETSSASRFEAFHGMDTTRFVGREAELATLLHGWEAAKAGLGRVALIAGEAGIGKSRLAHAFQERIADEPHLWLRYQSSPFHINSPLRPIINHFQWAAHILPADAPEQKFAKLEALVLDTAPAMRDQLDLFAALLSIPQPGTSRLAQLTPVQQRRKTIAALLSYIEHLSKQQPLLLLFEDIHWADASSRECLDLLVGLANRLRVLVLATSRPGEDISWSGLDQVDTLGLGPLNESSVHSMIEGLNRDQPLSPPLMTEIARRSDGIPLFVEEMTKIILETESSQEEGVAGVGPTRKIGIPATLHDLLMARLDRLGAAKEVAQIGAAIGREFSHPLLEAVADLDAEELNDKLAKLTQSGLLQRRVSGEETIYLFKHALVQDAAYETVSRSRRQKLHGRVVAAVRAKYPDQASTQPEIVAYHYTAAGMVREALVFWLAAGQRAVERSANKEAIAHFRQGLGLLQATNVLPQDERRSKELQFLTFMGGPLMAVYGYGVRQSEETFQRAYELLDKTTPPAERMRILSGLWNVRFHRAELAPALTLAKEIIGDATTSGYGLALANCQMGQALAAMGEFEEARRYFQKVIDDYRAGRTDPVGYFLVHEHVLAFAYMGRILWSLGYPEQSMWSAEEAISLAQQGTNSITVATALVGRMFMTTHGAPLEEAIARAHEAAAYCNEQGLVLFEHWLRFNHGALVAKQGDLVKGIELMREAIAAAEQRQSFQFRPFQLSCIGAAYLHLRQFNRALPYLDDALALAETGGEKQSLAALHRIRAEILIGMGRPEEGWRHLDFALATARRQHARMEELRIAMTRLKFASVAGDGDATMARTDLRRIYDSFTEGHAFPDLRTAKSLMADLPEPSVQ